MTDGEGGRRFFEHPWRVTFFAIAYFVLMSGGIAVCLNDPRPARIWNTISLLALPLGCLLPSPPPRSAFELVISMVVIGCNGLLLGSGLSWILNLCGWPTISIGETRGKSGLCPNCGYDLRGSPHSARCPECGAVTSQRMRARKENPRIVARFTNGSATEKWKHEE
jgi:hypothetical protein